MIWTESIHVSLPKCGNEINEVTEAGESRSKAA